MEVRMENCIFCKIAGGEIPSATVYEDEDFRAVLDIAPAAKGHVLIIPKEHMTNLLDISENAAAKAFALASRIAAAQKKVLGCDGINLLQNSGEAAWQSVFHLHIHLIPRYKDDNVMMPWKTLSYEEGEAAELAGKLGTAIA